MTGVGKVASVLSRTVEKRLKESFERWKNIERKMMIRFNTRVKEEPEKKVKILSKEHQNINVMQTYHSPPATFLHCPVNSQMFKKSEFNP